MVGIYEVFKHIDFILNDLKRFDFNLEINLCDFKVRCFLESTLADGEQIFCVLITTQNPYKAFTLYFWENEDKHYSYILSQSDFGGEVYEEIKQGLECLGIFLKEND